MVETSGIFQNFEMKLEQSTVWVDAVSKSHEIFLNEFQSSVSYMTSVSIKVRLNLIQF